MAKKKSRKPKSKAISVPLPQAVKATPAPGAAAPRGATAPTATTAESIAAAQARFTDGLLAAAMFALLVILALVIG